MQTSTEVAVIGAGPYGLSLAAHLRSLGVDFQIFGRPMDAWRRHMPEGMLLKSDGFASNLSDPKGDYPLARFCGEAGIPYDDKKIPVRLDTFVDYGLDFARRFVPDIKDRLIVSLGRIGGRFKLVCEAGDIVVARRVVVATGIGAFARLPPQLSDLPPEYASHSYDHHHLSDYHNRQVAIIGAGASAIDLAALLSERGAKVELICRAPKVKFGSKPREQGRSFWQRLRHPSSGLGPGWRSRLCTDGPLLFHALPAPIRLPIVRQHLGPAAFWLMRAKIEGRVDLLTSHEIAGASVAGGRVRLSLLRADGTTVVTSADQVIAGTGYRVDIQRLRFIDQALQRQIACLDQTPVLSARFESSVKGLFFIGPIAANSFGPLMRFAFGARFASRRVARVLKPRALTDPTARPAPLPI